MLTLILPKAKVARALLDCADAYAAAAKAEERAYGLDLEKWSRGQEGRPPTPPKKALKDGALKFMQMASACAHSIGDVYVDFELWQEIKGYYY